MSNLLKLTVLEERIVFDAAIAGVIADIVDGSISDPEGGVNALARIFIHISHIPRRGILEVIISVSFYLFLIDKCCSFNKKFVFLPKGE